MEEGIWFTVDRLQVSISETREFLGKIGARDASSSIRKMLDARPEVNIIFASAPSQMDVLNNLLLDEGIDWSRVNAFHMDEYIGLPPSSPQSFGNYLQVRFFSKLQLKNVFYINGMSQDLEAECLRYAQLLMEYPVDIAFLGIGENGHLAFNDPHIADFQDTALVKINPGLDAICRSQQVTDGWFSSEDEIPISAFTLTIPALLAAKEIFTFVPGSTKKDIIKVALEGPITEACPGSIIRTHESSRLYLDKDSASRISLLDGIRTMHG